jgi:hypothetical protein
MRDRGDHDPGIDVMTMVMTMVIAAILGARVWDDRGARSEETSLGLHDLDPSLCLYSPNLVE